MEKCRIGFNQLGKVLPILFAAVLVSGCHNGHRLTKLSHLHGLDELAVTAQLGRPDDSSVFTLHQGHGLPEFYIEIQNTYRPDDPKTEGVQIKELRWKRTGYTEALFLHKVHEVWRVLESCRWEDGVAY